MAFKKLEGLTKDGNPRTLFRAIAVNALQFQLAQEIIALYNGETKLTRKQCRDAHTALRGKKAAPYFISKNVVCKVKNVHGVYDLSRLKLAKSSMEVTETEPEKRESKPKRERKSKRETPAIAAPEVTTTELTTV
jgi:hypothetical protein